MLSQWRTARPYLPSLLIIDTYRTVQRSVDAFLGRVNPEHVLEEAALDTQMRELLQLCTSHSTVPCIWDGNPWQQST